MARKITEILLTETEFLELEEGYKKSKIQFSKRCHMILLKSKKHTAKQIAELLMTNQTSVYEWIRRYEKDGIKGLETKKGQGRKEILTKEEDEEKIRKLIKQERQRLSLIKEDIERETNKKFSMKTLQRFLKNLTAHGNE